MCKVKKENILKAAERYRLISEKTTDLVSLTTFDLAPVFTYVNPAHKSIMGYEQSELIGKDAFQFIHKDDKHELLALLKKYLDANNGGNPIQRNQMFLKELNAVQKIAKETGIIFNRPPTSLVTNCSLYQRI